MAILSLLRVQPTRAAICHRYGLVVCLNNVWIVYCIRGCRCHGRMALNIRALQPTMSRWNLRIWLNNVGWTLEQKVGVILLADNQACNLAWHRRKCFGKWSTRFGHGTDPFDRLSRSAESRAGLGLIAHIIVWCRYWSQPGNLGGKASSSSVAYHAHYFMMESRGLKIIITLSQNAFDLFPVLEMGCPGWMLLWLE